MEQESKKAQAIRCKCGSIFAAAVEPYCYSDSDWQKHMRKYVKDGCSVELINANDFKFEKCKCKELKQQKENQLSIF
jgi:hypothetical protein